MPASAPSRPALVLATATLLLAAGTAAAQGAASCQAQSGPTIAPVLELYTSEGCSSCPPADQWLSTLKDKAPAGAVIEAFHVGYWDYIGWVDRFATPAHTSRQRQVAGWNNLRSIYTPQAVLNGADWKAWGRGLPAPAEPAQASIRLRQLAPDQFEATVTPAAGAPQRWSAYWTLTEHGHTSKVKAGENAGATLAHDFVVRQYTPAGDYPATTGQPQTLKFRSLAPTPGHARQVNLVVFDPATGKTVQAVTAGC